jgi:hypothetical protein
MMRALACGFLLACAAAPAVAGDYDMSWLRGSTTDFPTPAPYLIWSGIYGGGQVGADFHGVVLDGGNGQLAAFAKTDLILSAVPVPSLPNVSLTKSGASFGGFS